jgi:hypothetical protein
VCREHPTVSSGATHRHSASLLRRPKNTSIPICQPRPGAPP